MKNDRNLIIQRKICPTNCTEHVFQTIPHHSGKTWIKSEIKVDFCPIQNEAGCHNIIPILNNDSLSCLPGFILEFDKIDYQNHMVRHKEEHERKIQEYTQKKKIMFLPKPGRKHRYCGVCRRQYDEYLEHIQSQDHVLNFKHHRFVGLITNIIKDTYGEANIKEEKKTVFSFQDSSTQQKQTPIIIEDDKPLKRRGRPPKNAASVIEVNKQEKKEKKNDKKLEEQLQNVCKSRYFNPYLGYKYQPYNFALYPEQCLPYQTGGQQFLVPQNQIFFPNGLTATYNFQINYPHTTFQQYIKQSTNEIIINDNNNKNQKTIDKKDGYILT